jgi:hypothetical protein
LLIHLYPLPKEAEQAEGIMNVRRSNKDSHSSPRPAGPVPAADRGTLREEAFLRVIWHERKRAERSGKPSLLMLIEMDAQFPSERNGAALAKILSALAPTTRETDVTGWYKDDSVLGVMFTEITIEDGSSIVTTVMNRVSEALRSRLSSRQFNLVSISFHLFPEERDERIPAMRGDAPLYPDPATRDEAGRLVQR